MDYAKAIIEKLVELRPDLHHYTGIFGNHELVADNKAEVAEKFKYLPEANLKDIFNDLEKLKYAKNFEDFMNDLAVRNYLKFKPFVTKNAYGTPTLVLRHNRFVHLFRGYYFQVSYSANGEGEYRTANVRLDNLLSNIKKIMLVSPDDCDALYDGTSDKELSEAVKRSKLPEIVAYMNCINVCFGIEAFDKLLVESPEVVDEFVREAMSKVIPGYSLTYKELVSSICTPENDFLELQDPLVVYKIPDSATQDICRVSIYDWHSICVEAMTDKTYHKYLYTIPEIKLSEVFLETYKDCLWVTEFPEELKKSLLLQLVSFALNSVGVVCNYMVAYSVYKGKNANLLSLNNKYVKVLNSLNDVVAFTDRLH